MKIILLAVMLAAGTANAYSPTNDSLVWRTFFAVCIVEGNRSGVHADGLSHGPAGITKDCLADANEEMGTSYTLSDCDDILTAYNVFVAYTERRCRLLHKRPTAENRVRMWHPNDEGYVERVGNLAKEE